MLTLVNTYPSRSLTAEDSWLYLTFDEILSKIRMDADEPSKGKENLFPVITLDDTPFEETLKAGPDNMYYKHHW